MADIIKTLEEATEGSRELDEEIYLWLHPPEPELTEAEIEEARQAGKSIIRNCKFGLTPHYTTSLDAKLSWENIIMTTNCICTDGKVQWFAVHLPLFPSFVGPNGAVNTYQGEGATEPLARRIAALKAREAL